MKTPKEFWTDKFGEPPQNKFDKLAIAMMQEYADYISSQSKQILDNLLCTIHRDGGQFISENGYQKAYDEAMKKIIVWLQKEDSRPLEPHRYKEPAGLSERDKNYCFNVCSYRRTKFCNI